MAALQRNMLHKETFGFLLCFPLMPQLLRLIFAFKLILFQGGIQNL